MPRPFDRGGIDGRRGDTRSSMVRPTGSQPNPTRHRSPEASAPTQDGFVGMGAVSARVSNFPTLGQVPPPGPRRPLWIALADGRVHAGPRVGRADAINGQRRAILDYSQCPPRRLKYRHQLAIFSPSLQNSLTAPIRNETPGFPRLTGTNTPIIRIEPERMTKNPLLKSDLKTTENAPHDQPPGSVSSCQIEAGERPRRFGGTGRSEQ